MSLYIPAIWWRSDFSPGAAALLTAQGVRPVFTGAVAQKYQYISNIIFWLHIWATTTLYLSNAHRQKRIILLMITMNIAWPFCVCALAYKAYFISLNWSFQIRLAHCNLKITFIFKVFCIGSWLVKRRNKTWVLTWFTLYGFVVLSIFVANSIFCHITADTVHDLPFHLWGNNGNFRCK